MMPTLEQYCRTLVNGFDQIPAERKALLEKITDHIRQKRGQGKPVSLVYICTHNSRRSHFGQVWAHVAADFYKIEEVHSFSGGTETTAFHPNAISALIRAGFLVKQVTEGKNPVYEVSHSEKADPCICFSKTYDHSANPRKGFAAIMTCSDAEQDCPYIPGVELRVGTAYDDPKAFDGTPLQDTKYDERCRQIAVETFYVFSKVDG